MHSPLIPWEVRGERGEIWSACRGWPPRLITRVEGCPTKAERLAMAAFIVKAANCHGALIAALKAMEAACEHLAAGRPQAAYDAMIDGGQTDALLALDTARMEARAALALAGGEGGSP